MPRGKRTVYCGTCPTCSQRVGTTRLHKQNKKGIGWKEFENKKKYCKGCRKRVDVKLKEEKHSK